MVDQTGRVTPEDGNGSNLAAVPQCLCCLERRPGPAQRTEALRRQQERMRYDFVPRKPIARIPRLGCCCRGQIMKSVNGRRDDSSRERTPLAPVVVLVPGLGDLFLLSRADQVVQNVKGPLAPAVRNRVPGLRDLFLLPRADHAVLSRRRSFLGSGIFPCRGRIMESSRAGGHSWARRSFLVAEGGSGARCHFFVGSSNGREEQDPHSDSEKSTAKRSARNKTLTPTPRKSSNGQTRKAQQKRFLDDLLAELNLRCPRCRKLQDPDPKGCCNMQCRWCGERFCWACFQCGFADKVDVYDQYSFHVSIVLCGSSGMGRFSESPDVRLDAKQSEVRWCSVGGVQSLGCLLKIFVDLK